MTSTQSTTSLINSKQSSNTSAPQHPAIEQCLSVPLPHRKMNINDETNDSHQQQHRLIINTSQSKEAASRGISPRFNRSKPSSSNNYNPSSVEKL